MANPTSLFNGAGGRFEVSTTASSCQLDSKATYTIHHLSRDTSGNADTHPIYFSFVKKATSGDGSGADVLTLLPSTSMSFVAPGNFISFICAAGGPTFQMIQDKG